MQSGSPKSHSVDKQIKSAADSTVNPIEQAGAVVVELGIILEWFQDAIEQRSVELFEDLEVDDTDTIARRG